MSEKKVSLDEFYQKLPFEILTLDQMRQKWEVGISNPFREHADEEQTNLETKGKKKQSNENKALIIDDVKRDSAFIQQKKHQNRKRSHHILNGKQRKRLFALDSKNIALKYKVFQQVHRLWRQYMIEMIRKLSPPTEALSVVKSFKSIVDQGNLTNSLIKADYHGAKFLVTRSKNPTLIGQKGIVVQETRNTFVIINERNLIRSKFLFLRFARMPKKKKF